ncbi:hypothetical protein [Bradyrhizobium sp. 179]|uniref:hypothetical protein n=1 Tax=Bradyrhizobium sp. 179 TaxID=2782648 RepID=UPI001FF9F20A|nr:hypothetical protein [Bradyrhizobium sp. 179]
MAAHVVQRLFTQAIYRQSGAKKKESSMKKLALGVAAAASLALSALSLPARAMPVQPIGATATPDLLQARYHYHPRRVCTVRTVVTRGYHGRRVVKRVRVCR